MRIPFVAYADDCTVTGEIGLETDRLADFLASTETFEVDGAAFQALDDGRVVEADSADILLEDLCLVAATGPRGQLERRLWTRQFPARVRLGPYTVSGYLHAPPTIDPFKNMDRRSIVALTSSVLEFDMGGAVTRVDAEAVLLNRSKIDLLEPVGDAELRPSTRPEMTVELDPRSKDMTGEFYG